MDFWRQQYVQVQQQFSATVQQYTEAMRTVTLRHEVLSDELDRERARTEELQARIVRLEQELADAREVAMSLSVEAETHRVQASTSSYYAKHWRDVAKTASVIAHEDYAQALEDLNSYRSLVNEAVTRLTGRRATCDEGFYKLLPALQGKDHEGIYQYAATHSSSFVRTGRSH